MKKGKLFAVILFLAFTGKVFAESPQQIYVAPEKGQQPGLQLPSTQLTQTGQTPQQVQPLAPQELKTETVQPSKPEAAVSSEKPSAFERYISGEIQTSVSLDIKQFGYELFRHPPSTFAPADKAPVGPDYVIGPGDEVRVSVWGKVEGQWTVTVDRDGSIGLPKVGIFGVAGLTFKELKDLLRKEFSKYYTGFEMNVSMGALRSIRVYLVGNAEKPGAYTVSSLSTLVNAIFAAGGPAKNGTLRDIQVKRNGNTVVHFDMYDFLLNGDKTKDIRLMPEDVIFIPPVGPLVGIAGNVKSPAIYESKGEAGLLYLIRMAGGVLATGYLQQVQLERVFENKAKQVTDIDLSVLKDDKDIPLKDGDIVRVFSISKSIVNPIELKGNLLRPGVYEWRQGMRVKDLIRSTDDLLPDTLLDFAMIERMVPPDYHKEYLSTGLGRLLLRGDEKENLQLMPFDTIMVFNKWDIMAKEKVRITGSVNKEGEYEYRPNMRFSDLLRLAGGTKYFAYLNTAELTRVTPTTEGPKTEKITIHLEKAIKGDPQEDILLKPDDYIFVRAVPEWQLYRKVTISGEVRFPGVYTIKKGETLSSLIERAGGFTDKAYLGGGVFTRESVKEMQRKNLSEAIDRLEKQMIAGTTESVQTALTPEAAQQQKIVIEQQRALITKMKGAKAQGRVVIKLDALESFKGSSYDIELEDGDNLNIPERPASVQVIGSVYNSTAFVYNAEEDLSDYIDMAGGMTAYADKKEIFVLKADGSAASRRQGGYFFMSKRLDPGDTVVVPEKVERIAWMREIKDITQILFQIAVTTGVLITLF